MSVNPRGNVMRSALINRVHHVFSVCPKEHVTRINAGRIVASMANLHAGRNRTISEFPRDSMGERFRPASTTPLHTTIAVVVDYGSPYPAVSRLVNFRPEVINKRGVLSAVRTGRTAKSGAPLEYAPALAEERYSATKANDRKVIVMAHRKVPLSVSRPRQFALRGGTFVGEF